MSEFAGTLRERILIECRVAARTPAGLRTEAWEKVASCRAAISPEGWGGQEEGAAMSASSRFRVTLRRRPDLAIDQRIRWGSRRLRVRQIHDDPRLPDRISLRCEEERE